MFSLGGWSPLLPARFHVSYSTLVPPGYDLFTPTGLSPSPAGFPKTVPLKDHIIIGGPQPHGARTVVWAPPRSLAATYGIDVSFSSSRYLDVSVPGLTPVRLCIYRTVHGVRPCGFPHSDIHGSIGYVLLPVAFRSLSRLSSAQSAWASAPRPSSLDLLSVARFLLAILEVASCFCPSIFQYFLCFSMLLPVKHFRDTIKPGSPLHDRIGSPCFQYLSACFHMLSSNVFLSIVMQTLSRSHAQDLFSYMRFSRCKARLLHAFAFRCRLEVSLRFIYINASTNVTAFIP